jgi:hypothetical protein
MSLGVYQFIRNGVIYDYPFLESLESVVPIADQIVVCECESEDNTLELLQQFQEKYKDKVTIVRHSWARHFTELSVIGNYAALFLDTDFKWHVQSDEVIHENQYNNIKAWIKLVEKHNLNVTALTTKYIHFVCNYETTFPFVYDEIIRIHRRGSNWMLVGDACQLAGGSEREVLHTDITVYHYGKVHSGEKGWKKEWDFQQLFKDIGFPDPKMLEMKEKLGKEYCDYLFLFEKDIIENKIKKFTGTHPKVMHKRIKEFKDNNYEQFVSKIKENLRIQYES